MAQAMCRDSLGLFGPRAGAPRRRRPAGAADRVQGRRRREVQICVFEVPLAHLVWRLQRVSCTLPRSVSRVPSPLLGAAPPLWRTWSLGHTLRRTSLLSWDSVPSGQRLRVCRCRSVLPCGDVFPRLSAQQLCRQTRQDCLLGTHSSCSVCGAFGAHGGVRSRCERPGSCS